MFTPRNDDGKGIGGHRPRFLLSALAILAALAALAGCEINSPEMPTFDTTMILPIGTERVEILDALDDEDYLVQEEDGSVSFFIEGDPDTMDFDFELSTDIGAQSISEGLGDFELAALDPMSYAFALGDLWAPASGVSGMTAPVPAFPIDVVSSGQDLPDVESATLASGSVTISVSNGLPVPVSADSGPDRIQLVLEAVDGTPVATFFFDEIAPGATASESADLAGVILPGSVRVRLTGGSPGSGGAFVTVDGSDSIGVEAVFSDLVVSEAVAAVGAQSFTTSFDTELPADYEIMHAVIEQGSVSLDLTNAMAIPCTAELTWSAIVDLDGNPLVESFVLSPYASASRTIDFAGRIVDGGGSALTSLSADVRIDTPGSGGSPVALSATDGLTADLTGGSLAFASVTGLVPAEVVSIDPIEEEIDLPDELDGLQLQAATMALHVTNSSGLPGDVELTLTGTSPDGSTRTMAIDRTIAASATRAAETTTIILNETNSTLIDFLNNLPDRIALEGQVTLGGDIGTVHADDYAAVNYEITAPVLVVIEDATVDSDPELMDTDEDIRDLINDHIRGARLETEILNHLPMGVEIRILAGPDTLTLADSPQLELGPFSVAAATVDPVTYTVSEPVTSMPTLELTEEQARVFGQPDLFTMFAVQLPSTDGQPVRLMASDYVEIRGVVRIDFEVSDD